VFPKHFGLNLLMNRILWAAIRFFGFRVKTWFMERLQNWNRPLYIIGYEMLIFKHFLETLNGSMGHMYGVQWHRTVSFPKPLRTTISPFISKLQHLSRSTLQISHIGFWLRCEILILFVWMFYAFNYRVERRLIKHQLQNRHTFRKFEFLISSMGQMR